jgi:N-acyl-phosphatidylethanolamine-hydrolysing phospholipase D
MSGPRERSAPDPRGPSPEPRAPTRDGGQRIGATSHHRPGGGFLNPWPDSEPHTFKEFLRWRVRDRWRTRVAPSPPRGSLPRATPSIVVPAAEPGYRSATWVGQATVLLQLGALNILTDPMWSDRASPFRWLGPRRLMAPGVDFDALPPIDVVLLSHNHYDHLDAPTVRRIAKWCPDAQWLCPLGLEGLLRSFGARQVSERDWWQTASGPGFTATCTPARHFSGRGFPDRGDTLWCGWTIAADGVRVYFAGDTARHPEFSAISAAAGPFDLVMLPIGAYAPRWFMGGVHMNPEDGIEAYRALTSPGTARPPCLALHWGTFRLTDEPVEEPPARFAQRWQEAGFPDGSNWTFAIGETRRL